MPVNSEAVVSRLRRLPEEAIVRVVVKGGGAELREAKLPELRPKDFPDATAYRTALLRQRKKQMEPGKAYVLETAKKLGLSASPANALDLVTLEGSAKGVLAFIVKVHPERVIFDRPIRMIPPPKGPRIARALRGLPSKRRI